MIPASIVFFETADSAARTRIGEGLVTFAVPAGRIETGQGAGTSILDNADGRGGGGRCIAPGDGFDGVPDPEQGNCLRVEYGRPLMDSG